jgi:NADPH:quinone reductase-like Zn-dependent oxidoreductase
MKMKTLILERYGKSDQLAFAEIPRPTIQPDEMLVQLFAADLNPIDYVIPKGNVQAHP